MAYGLSNTHVIDDVTWPGRVKLVTPRRLERNTFNTAGFRDSVPNYNNRKWPIGYQMVTWTTTSGDPQRCYETVRSAILATAWLLISPLFNSSIVPYRTGTAAIQYKRLRYRESPRVRDKLHWKWNE